MKNRADFFKALSDETRLRILEIIAQEESCNCQLMERLNISQSMVSHHIKILKQAGIIDERRNGKWTYYTINIENTEAYLVSLCTKLTNKDIEKHIKKHDSYECERLQHNQKKA
ncbi:metalloregulator ArsR/SmtB family transcription factor [Desulfosporosinus sp.]|uniref:ArsR/SmtB family transcription factor n=1 Tax=Desulfosporosinus sp. TaxID=157907 RepID=UPI00262582AA|nr:metalloregulator ArsR/SmtB family transcription factor [Desulfosporosinus sp.]